MWRKEKLLRPKNMVVDLVHIARHMSLSTLSLGGLLVLFLAFLVQCIWALRRESGKGDKDPLDTADRSIGLMLCGAIANAKSLPFEGMTHTQATSFMHTLSPDEYPNVVESHPRLEAEDWQPGSWDQHTRMMLGAQQSLVRDAAGDKALKIKLFAETYLEQWRKASHRGTFDADMQRVMRLLDKNSRPDRCGIVDLLSPTFLPTLCPVALAIAEKKTALRLSGALSDRDPLLLEHEIEFIEKVVCLTHRNPVSVVVGTVFVAFAVHLFLSKGQTGRVTLLAGESGRKDILNNMILYATVVEKRYLRRSAFQQIAGADCPQVPATSPLLQAVSPSLKTLQENFESLGDDSLVSSIVCGEKLPGGAPIAPCNRALALVFAVILRRAPSFNTVDETLCFGGNDIPAVATTTAAVLGGVFGMRLVSHKQKLIKNLQQSSSLYMAGNVMARHIREGVNASTQPRRNMHE